MLSILCRRTINVTRPSLPPLERYVEYLRQIWKSGWLTNDGELVHVLGERLEQYLKARNLVLVSNGTLAMELALRALDVKGEVITTPFTFAATTNVLLWLGLTPVFADIDPETYNIDPDAVEDQITERTRAILAVHVYGNPCSCEDLQKVAEKHGLRLIYDAAHAFGVEYNNHSVLNYGEVSTLSFHATKVFNTVEGGAVIARDAAVFERLRLLRNHGIRSEEEVVLPGTNGKMSEFQAAMGLCNLVDVDEMVRLRRVRYERYVERLGGVGGVRFQRLVASRYNYCYMPVCFDSRVVRDAVFLGLCRVGVNPRKYFFPLTVDYDYFKGTSVGRGGLPNAVGVADRVLCLPLYPDLEVSSVDLISDKIVEICS